MTEEHKTKISLANKGRKLSKETKIKMSIAHKGKKFSEEHKRKIGEYKLKNPVRYWLGKKRLDISNNMKNRIISLETRTKMSNSKKGKKYHLGYKASSETIKKLRESHLGYKQTEETKRKIGLASKGNKYCLGKHPSLESRIRMSLSRKGKRSHLWKGGINLINDTIRKSIETRLWREAVFARDNWTCQKTKIKGCKLHPHHIQNFAQYPELRFAIDNGITLSEKSHMEFHKKYGYRNNTKQQIEEFVSQEDIKKYSK